MKCRTKGNVFVTKEQVELACQKEIDSKLDKLYEEVRKDVAKQVMATCLFELNKEFDFENEKLLQFFNGVSSMFILMGNGVVGKEFTPIDCIKHCKECFGINLDDE